MIKNRKWWIIAAAVTVAVLVGGLMIGRAIIRSQYYVASYNGTVTVMRGNQGSILGVSLHEPYLVGCLNAQNELSFVSFSSSGNADCQPLKLVALRPSPVFRTDRA